MEFKGFDKTNIGDKVHDVMKGLDGVITDFSNRPSVEYKIDVLFNTGCSDEYTECGRFSVGDKRRQLYFGHNIKVEIAGEEVPVPKLICPICDKEHEIKQGSIDYYYISAASSLCPLAPARFGSIERAEKALENLIKAMDK